MMLANIEKGAIHPCRIWVIGHFTRFSILQFTVGSAMGGIERNVRGGSLKRRILAHKKIW